LNSGGLNITWERFPIDDFSCTIQDKEWTIKQITNGEKLNKEGEYMHNCVFSYMDQCIDKKRSIFSLRCRDKSGSIGDKSATVEIASDKSLSQARGRFNNKLNIETKDIIKKWTKENGININNYFGESNEVINDDIFFEEM
jgi:predicted component of viral defense system (DUF524 family)